MQGSLKTQLYVKEVNKLAAAEGGLSSVTQKIITQTEALNISAKFNMGTITAKEYDAALKNLIADKEKLLLLDNKTISYMTRTGKEAEQRENARKIAEQRSDVILIASFQTFSTGVNIKNLTNIIFASPTKSKIRVLQSVGRGLRTHADKERCNLYDITDRLS